MENSKSKALHKMTGGKTYEMHHDALGKPMLGIHRGKETYEGYRKMSGPSRYNARMHRIFEHAKENKSDPVLKSFNRKHRKRD